MNTKTLITLLAVFAFVWVVVSTIQLNAQNVQIQLAFLPPLTLELWKVIMAAFSIGAAVILLFDMAGGARRYAKDWRQRKVHRENLEIEDLYLLGLDSMLHEHYEQALERFDEVLDRVDDHLEALIKKGDSLRLLGRFREAASSLEHAARLAPDNLGALYSLTDTYEELKAAEKAQHILQRIIEIGPETTVSAHRKLRDMFVGQGKWGEADEIQQKILPMVSCEEEESFESDILKGIRLGLADQQIKSGENKAGLASYRSILELDDRFVPAYVSLGNAFAALGDTEEAVKTWKLGYDATGSVEPLVALQSYYLKLEQPQDAIGIWKQALVLSDNEVPLRYSLGKLYYRLFMLDEALQELQLIEDHVSDLPALSLLIAQILESKGDLSGALAKTKALMVETEGLMMDYNCSACGWRSTEWTGRCDSCDRWNSVGLHLQTTAAPEPAIRPAPTWSTN